MVVNFMTRVISRGTRKLARTPTLVKKKYIEAIQIKKVVEKNFKILFI
jgi:hypothetical protein